jgi:hypothetical protein
MAKHPGLWILGGIAVLYLAGRGGALGSTFQGMLPGGYVPAQSPVGGFQGLFSGLSNAINSIGTGLPSVGGGAYQPGWGSSGLLSPINTGNYMPVNYSPAGTTAPPTAGSTPYTGLLSTAAPTAGPTQYMIA